MTIQDRGSIALAIGYLRDHAKVIRERRDRRPLWPFFGYGKPKPSNDVVYAEEIANQLQDLLERAPYES